MPPTHRITRCWRERGSDTTAHYGFQTALWYPRGLAAVGQSGGGGGVLLGEQDSHLLPALPPTSAGAAQALQGSA